MPLDLFASSRRQPAQAQQVKAWVAAAFALPEDATVLVTELQCSEPGCPPLETVISILESGGRRQFKIHQALADLTESDIRQLTA
jgi:hypothetical protein